MGGASGGNDFSAQSHLNGAEGEGLGRGARAGRFNFIHHPMARSVELSGLRLELPINQAFGDLGPLSGWALIES